MYRFQSTRPLRDGTYLPEEQAWVFLIFQSTRPLRDGTPSLDTTEPQVLFQSTRPLRDGTHLAR